jgi:hypothetical protein
MSEHFGAFDVGPAAELQKKYGWYVENWVPRKLDSAQVPPELHDLIPLAARWGITCDITRHDAGEKASREELDEVAEMLKGRHKQIYSWLYSDKGNSVEASTFSALLVFEMEEADGPGIPGLLDWRLQEYKESPDSANRQKLREAIETVRSWGRSLGFRPLIKEAESILRHSS